jgi:alkanesulfonate monooxygenase SsuD/methylene tetrahydromethanopterin reductase-like flavin-dependent oxidoreductase (luciferase family)
LKIGIYLDLRNPAPWHQDWSRLYASTLELCEEAERLGAASIWTSEHHLFNDGYLPQPLTFAAAIAARTVTARIGTAILIAPLRPAIAIAEEAAVVDLVSGGRLDLGLGAGYRVPEFEAYDADMSVRYATTDRRVRELRQIWADGAVTPPPVQARVPIWMGYNGPRGARRAGRLGEGLLSVDPALLAPYVQGLEDGGHEASCARMAGSVDAFFTDDPERDWPIVAPRLAYQWDSYRRNMVEGTDQPVPRPIDPDHWRSRGFAGTGSFLFGPPEEAANAIRNRLAGMPVDTIYFWASLAGLPTDLAVKHLELIFTRLVPALAVDRIEP